MFPEQHFNPYLTLPFYYSTYDHRPYPLFIPPHSNFTHFKQNPIIQNQDPKNESENKNLDIQYTYQGKQPENKRQKGHLKQQRKKLKKGYCDNNQKKSEYRKKDSNEPKQKKKKIYMTEKMIYRSKESQNEVLFQKRSLRKLQKKRARECITKQFKKEEKYHTIQRVFEKNKKKILFKRNRRLKKDDSFLNEYSLSIASTPRNNLLLSQEKISRIFQSLKSRQYTDIIIHQ